MPSGPTPQAFDNKSSSPAPSTVQNPALHLLGFSWRSLHPRCSLPTPIARVSINELLLAFLKHAEQHYRRPDRTTTNEVSRVQTDRPPRQRTVTANSPPTTSVHLPLKAVRQRFIDAGWCRGFINQRIGRVRRMFKWGGVSEELVSSAVYHALAAVPGLQRGRTSARESKPVGPVNDAVVDATLPYLNRHVRGLVEEFQRLTGCRPSEACAVRRCDIDTGGAIWLYNPAQHKTAWRGKTRTIAIGPKNAQELLKGFFTPELGAFLFSPARAVEELRAERSAKRTTPRYPSHMRRNAAKWKAKPEAGSIRKVQPW